MSEEVLLAEDILKLKVKDLKAEILSRGLKPKGLKKDLQKQLIDYCASESVDRQQNIREPKQAIKAEQKDIVVLKDNNYSIIKTPENELKCVKNVITSPQFLGISKSEPEAAEQSEPEEAEKQQENDIITDAANEENSPAPEAEKVLDAEVISSEPSAPEVLQKEEEEQDEDDVANSKAMAMKRSWTHTAKDGNTKSPRLRKRTNSEMIPPAEDLDLSGSPKLSEKEEETDETTDTKLTPLKRTWTHTAKNGNNTSPRLRKRTDSEMISPEDLDLCEPATKKQKTEHVSFMNSSEEQEEANKMEVEVGAAPSEEQATTTGMEMEEKKAVATEVEDKKEEKTEEKNDAPTLAKTLNPRFIKDLLSEMEESELRKYLQQLIDHDPTLLDKLKKFMHTHTSMCKLFIRGLSLTQTEDDLRDIYGKYGTLRDVRILRDRMGVSKTFGFLVFNNSDETLAALERPERRIGERTMYLNLAMKPNKDSGSGFKTGGLQ